MLKDAIKPLGGTVVQEKIGKASATYYVRIPPKAAAAWEGALRAALTDLHLVEREVDVSKYFFTAGDAVRYLWRLVVSRRGEDEGRDAVAALALACERPEPLEAAPLGLPALARKPNPFDAALGRVGAQVVREQAGETSSTRYLAVDLAQGEKWVDAIREFLVALPKKAAALPNGSPSVTADVSKQFFVRGGNLHYLWRAVFQGDVEQADALLTACALEVSMAWAPTITSFPLVGRITYTFDPARGKLKGGHDFEQAPGILNVAISGVGGAT